MFIHDALSELVVCGETEMAAGDLRIKMNKLERQVAAGITGYQRQFQVKWSACRDGERECVFVCLSAIDSGGGEWPVPGLV